VALEATAEGALSILTSRAAGLGLLAAALWAPATGFPTWPALARGRFGSTLGVTVVVGFGVFTLARAFGAARGV
jgi:hypothetical protein